MSLTATAHQPMIGGTTRLIGLLGDPVSHSLSPAMHNAALAILGFDAVYVALPVKPDNLPAAIAGLRAIGFLGANVTLPHKTAVIPLLDEISPLSRTLGAVNTIVRRADGSLYGDTTDAAGFIGAFEDVYQTFDHRSVAILGNGGSARTLAIGLPVKRRIPRVTLVARNPAKAEALADEVRAALRDPANQAVSPDAVITVLSVEQYAAVAAEHDVVVNTTPVGMTPAVDQTPLPDGLLDPRQIVYDIVYNPEETRLLREAKARGCAVLGGLGMLVHQGKVSFEMWMKENGRGESTIDSSVFYEGIRRQQAARTGSRA